MFISVNSYTDHSPKAHSEPGKTLLYPIPTGQKTRLHPLTSGFFWAAGKGLIPCEPGSNDLAWMGTEHPGDPANLTPFSSSQP